LLGSGFQGADVPLPLVSRTIPGLNYQLLTTTEPQQFSIWLQLRLSLTLRHTVSRPACLGIKTHLGLKPTFLLLSDSCGFVDVGRSLWQEDRSVVYSWCWSSPAQSFSGPSPVGLVTIFYCLRLPVSSPPTTRTATVEVFDPASTRYTQIFWLQLLTGPGYNTSARAAYKTSLPLLLCSLVAWKHVCLRSCYLTMAVVYLLISWSLPSNGSTYHIASALRLFVLDSLQAYRHFFFSEGCACDVCDRLHLPSRGSVLTLITLQPLPLIHP
jgi:hypothetical protein